MDKKQTKRKNVNVYAKSDFTQRPTFDYSFLFRVCMQRYFVIMRISKKRVHVGFFRV